MPSATHVARASPVAPLQKNLKAFRIGRRHDWVDTSSVLRADCAIQIDVFTNELAGDLRPNADGCPARSRAVHPTERRFDS
jgi:hypothetical protein